LNPFKSRVLTGIGRSIDHPFGDLRGACISGHDGEVELRQVIGGVAGAARQDFHPGFQPQEHGQKDRKGGDDGLRRLVSIHHDLNPIISEV